MIAFVVRRCFQLLPVMLGITLVTFILMNVVGDPVMQLLDQRQAGMDEAAIQSIRRQWGLDQPLPVQYLRFVGNALRGDLGRSFASREPVAEAVLSRFPATFQLGLAAMALAVAAGVALGTLAAVYRSSWFDFLTMVAALAGVSLPVFWLGLMLMYLLAVKWRLLPASGYGNGHFQYLIMPAVTLAAGITAVIARITRSAMLEVIRADYVVTARAKGLSEWQVTLKHALRNALIPVITIIGVEMGSVLSGAVITETIFNWPGVGRLLVDSINKRDLPMVQGSVIFIALLFAMVNLVVDISYALVDPRVRYD